MDPLVSRLNKAAMIPVENSPSFKDMADRKVESAACTMFSVTGSAGDWSWPRPWYLRL